MSGPEVTPAATRLGVSTRIFIGFAVMIIAFGSACAYTIYRMTWLRRSVTVIWEDVIPVAAELKELSRRIRAPEEFLDLRRPSDAQWLSRLLPSLQPFANIRAIEARLSRVVDEGDLPASDRELLRGTVDRLRGFREGQALYETLDGSAHRPQLELPAEHDSEALFDWISKRTVKRANEGLLTPASPEARLLVRTLREINRNVIEASRQVSEPIRTLNARAANDEGAATLAIFYVTGGALLLSLIILLMIQRTLRPLRSLREGARRIAAGDYDERVDVRARDEIGQLASEFNTMASALRARDEELEQQRRELLRADRLATIGKMAAQITHEVRNPLSSIGLNAELLEEELDDSGEARAILAEIHGEVQRLKAITEEYLLYARLPRPNLQPVDVGAGLVQVLGFLQHELSGAGIELGSEGVAPSTEGGPQPILADPDQLRQAWLNIARNAREALDEVPAPRKLEVSLEALDDGAVRIRFTDNGPGIADGLIERIFEPFVTGKSGGTGLGLAMTQQIVADHGGSLAVRSQTGADSGTCFEMVLPARGRQHEVPATSPDPIHNPR